LPWEAGPMDARRRFVGEVIIGERSMTELCAAFGVSRKTGYKWLHRFKQEGPKGLRDRSREAYTKPHEWPAEMRELVLDLRRQRPRWGAKKLLGSLRMECPEVDRWPAVSTVGLWLKDADLVVSRRRRRRFRGMGWSLTAPEWPNHVWAGDFKGWFRTGNHRKCEPLTASDLASRKVLLCQAVSAANGVVVWKHLRKAFREYGMPWILRTDGGPPFGTPKGPISRLTVLLVKHGIQHEITRPGTPTDNGVHERMHRTLRQETAIPPAANLAGQQRRFEAFVEDFNDRRPHEALGQRTPASAWEPSPRSFPARTPTIEYEGWFHVRRIRHNGEVRFRGRSIFVSQALRHEHVGLEEVDNDVFRLWFGPVLIGLLDEGGHLIRGTTRGPKSYPPYDPNNTWNQSHTEPS